jgi:hypothetical protein
VVAVDYEATAIDAYNIAANRGLSDENVHYKALAQFIFIEHQPCCRPNVCMKFTEENRYGVAIIPVNQIARHQAACCLLYSRYRIACHKEAWKERIRDQEYCVRNAQHPLRALLFRFLFAWILHREITAWVWLQKTYLEAFEPGTLP